MPITFHDNKNQPIIAIVKIGKFKTNCAAAKLRMSSKRWKRSRENRLPLIVLRSNPSLTDTLWTSEAKFSHICIGYFHWKKWLCLCFMFRISCSIDPVKFGVQIAHKKFIRFC